MSATFLIYKDQQGGEPLFTESQIITFDSGGHYKVHLGAASPNGLPADLFSSGEARWLEVQIAGEPSQPRVFLASVPYALKAGDATTLGGLPASAYALAGSRSATSLVGSAALEIMPAALSNVTTTGGTSGTLPLFTGASTVGNSIVFQNSTDGIGIGAHPSSTAMLDVNGKAIVRGVFNLSRAGNASRSVSFDSYPFIFNTSAYSTTAAGDVSPIFGLQAEVVGNNSATPAATFNLLYNHNGGTPGETGFYFNSNGTIHFAAGQTFPGGTGTGTITGVTAGTGLTGGGTSGKVTLNLDTTKVPLLAKSNAFVGDQTITGNEYVSGAIGLGTSSPEAPIDIEDQNGGGQLLLLGAGPNAWAINSFGGGNGGLAGRFVGGAGSSGNAGGNGIAVAGGSTSDTGTGGYGASISGGYSYSGTGGDGIYVTAGNYGYANEGYAGNFTGNVYVSGSLYASSKSFRIDHPLDPANKYLNHTSTESSEMMNIYSGNVITDESGLSTVELPDWFETVNTDFRYQLTVVGQFAQAIIKNEIAGGHFTIMTNAPHVKVSWLITAVRQDAYAKANPMTVEEPKPANERGFYIHPELYGQPMTKQTEWGRHPQQMQQMKSMLETKRTGNQGPFTTELDRNQPATVPATK